jgi:hypothetical protein
MQNCDNDQRPIDRIFAASVNPIGVGAWAQRAKESPVIRVYLVFAALLALTACQPRQPPQIPTQAPAISVIATQDAATRNAPPAGFRHPVSFPQIDANLAALESWQIEAVLQFTGVFSNTTRRAEALTQLQVWYEQLNVSRRVVLNAAGVLVGQEDERVTREGVRLGPDTYLVIENTCRAGEDAAELADLEAGTVIGGVSEAVPSGLPSQVINGLESWRYLFEVDDLALLNVNLSAEGARVVSMSGELWLAPEYNVIVRFYLTMNVESVLLFDNAAPVTGELIIRYDLSNVGVPPNITQPFGC